jgi:hypothetical protein
MPHARRVASSLLLASGIVLVFTGINAALGFTLPGMVASIAAIAGLLYAGAVWFGGTPEPSGVAVFDHTLTLTNGSPLLARFSDSQKEEVRAKATATLAGAKASLAVDGRTFLMTPILSEGGAVLYGALVEVHRRATANLKV